MDLRTHLLITSLLVATVAHGDDAIAPAGKTLQEEQAEEQAIRDLALRDQSLLARWSLEVEYRLTYALGRSATPMGFAERRTFVNLAAARLGVARGLNLTASVPYVVRHSIDRGITDEGMSEVGEWNNAVGDASVGASYQLLAEAPHRPGLFLNAAVAMPTGESQFTSAFATGSGSFTPSLGAFVVYSTDPVVLVGSLTVGYGIPTEVDGRTAEPGLAINGRIGFTMILSESFALSFAVLGAGGQDAKLGGTRLRGSRPETYAALFGGLLSFGRMNLVIEVQRALIGDGGIAMTVGLPYRF